MRSLQSSSSVCLGGWGRDQGHQPRCRWPRHTRKADVGWCPLPALDRASGVPRRWPLLFTSSSTTPQPLLCLRLLPGHLCPSQLWRIIRPGGPDQGDRQTPVFLQVPGQIYSRRPIDVWCTELQRGRRKDGGGSRAAFPSRAHTVGALQMLNAQDKEAEGDDCVSSSLSHRECRRHRGFHP